jgi:hypothetical protein
MAWWFEKKPVFHLDGEWYGPVRATGWPAPYNVFQYQRYPDGLADGLPLGVDWRTTLRKRPKEQARVLRHGEAE